MRISDWSSDVCSDGRTRRGGIRTWRPPVHGMSECGDDVRAAAWLIRVYSRALSIPCDGGRAGVASDRAGHARSEEHTSELQSLMRISYAVFSLHKITHTHKYGSSSTHPT